PARQRPAHGLRAWLTVLPLYGRPHRFGRRFPMTTRSWIRNLFASKPRTIRKDRFRFRPTLVLLEQRLAPATITVSSHADAPHYNSNATITDLTNHTDLVSGNTDPTITLRDAINAANNTGGSDTIVLSNTTYDFTTADNYWYGPNALPAISSALTIDGGTSGAVLARSSSAGTPDFRLFYVSGGLSGLAAGSLTLHNLTRQGGYAKGGDSKYGGGGLGAGGAIFNQGTLALSGVTLTGNTAQGGSSGVSGLGFGGGGIGQDATGTGGGGFGGPL